MGKEVKQTLHCKALTPSLVQFVVDLLWICCTTTGSTTNGNKWSLSLNGYRQLSDVLLNNLYAVSRLSDVDHSSGVRVRGNVDVGKFGLYNENDKNK